MNDEPRNYILEASQYYIGAIPYKYHGVVMVYGHERSTFHTNIPIAGLEHSLDGFSWGYGGSGPADLALNILHWAYKQLPAHMAKNGSYYDCYTGRVIYAAYTHHQHFKKDFIANVPEEGGIIPWKVIMYWAMRSVGYEPVEEPVLDNRLSVFYPRHTFPYLQHLYSDMDVSLSESAWRYTLEQELSAIAPKHELVIKPMDVNIFPMTFPICDSNSIYEETDISSRAQEIVNDLFANPSTWLVKRASDADKPEHNGKSFSILYISE